MEAKKPSAPEDVNRETFHLTDELLRWQHLALQREERAEELGAEITKEQATVKQLQSELEEAAEALQQFRERQRRIARTKPYRLAHFLRRLEYDCLKGTREERKRFLYWLGQRLRGLEPGPNEAKNPLLEFPAERQPSDPQAQQAAEARELLAQLALRAQGSSGRPGLALQVETFDEGGLEELVFGLARHLQGRGFNLFVFVNDVKIGYLARRAIKEGIQVILLHRNPVFLRDVIRALELKLVNLHYSIFGVPEYAEAGVKLVYTVHSNYVWADDPVFFQQRKAAYDKCHGFIAVSSQVRRFFVETFQMQKRPVSIILNGLDCERLPQPLPLSKAGLGLNENDFVFVNVSSFSWLKCHVLLVAAMERLRARYPQFKMILMGNIIDPGCADHIKQMIVARGLTGVIRILDFGPKETVLGLLSMADCFVLPSLTEGCSIAVLEAMYCQLPLILTDVGAARDVIADSDLGLVIPPPYPHGQIPRHAVLLEQYRNESELKNLDSLCAAMENLFLHTAEWKQKGSQGKAKVQSVFNVQCTANSYLEEFARL